MTPQDYIVACVVATEVPPEPVGTFTTAMIGPAIYAVCDVIANRVADPAFPKTAVEVVLARNQFSAVCRQDYWVRAMSGSWFPEHIARCIAIWQTTPRPSLVGNARWYFSPVSMDPPGSTPSWLAGKTEISLPAVSSQYFRWFA